MHEMTRKGRKETGHARQAVLALFLQTHSQASLQMGFQKLRSIRFANEPVAVCAEDRMSKIGRNRVAIGAPSGEMFWNHEMHQLTRKGRKETGHARQAVLAVFLQTHSQASLQMGFQKLRSIRFANEPRF